MGKPQLVCCFIICTMGFVPTLGAPSRTGNGCNQKQPSNMVPWSLRNQVENGSFDILNLERPEYLKNFKNPCWKEQTEKGKEIRCLPYFFIAGVGKCGTTDLWMRIKLHPNVSTLGQGKEPHWWTRKRYEEETSSIDSYVELFQRTAKVIEDHPIETNGVKFYPLITGEASPDTLWKRGNVKFIPQNCPNDPEPSVHQGHLIKHLIPKAKIIVTLRNPVEAFFSMYLFMGNREWHEKTSEDFHEVTVKLIKKWNHCIKQHTWKLCAYKESEFPEDRFHSTIYVVYMRDWLELFPRDQIYVSQLEEYSQDKFKALNKIYKFLELDPIEDADLINDKPVRKVRHKHQDVKMKDKTRRLLAEFYKPYNLALSHLLKEKKWLYDV